MSGRRELATALAACAVAVLMAAAAPVAAADKATLAAVKIDLRHFLEGLDIDLAAAEVEQRGAETDERSVSHVVGALTGIRDDYRKRRAEEVKAWLESLGVTCRELKTLSYGDERPAAIVSEERCWQLHRSAKAHVVSIGAQ